MCYYQEQLTGSDDVTSLLAEEQKNSPNQPVTER